MQFVSEAWRAAQKERLLPPSDLEIELSVSDPDAQEDASASSANEEYYSTVANVTLETTRNQTRYATLEPGIWKLDGSCSLVPASGYSTNGYISSVLCGTDKVFATHPIITLTFSKIMQGTAPGLTITWSAVYQEYAESFLITAYHGAQIVAIQRVENNEDVTSVTAVDIQGYDKIEIEVLKWSQPQHRARLETILIGIVQIYGKSDVMDYTQSMSVDPLTATLPKSEIRVTLADVEGKYNPYNPYGSAKYLMERQRITVRYGYKLDGDIEWISGGTYFLSEWDAPQNGIQFSFTARDAIEYMNALYAGRSQGTFAEVAQDALEQANLPLMSDGTVRWFLSSTLNTLTIKEDVDLSRYTIMQVLQYIANAACCVFYQDRSGMLRIEPRKSDNTDYVIGNFLSYGDASLKITKQLRSININNGEYTYIAGVVGEEQQVNNEILTAEQARNVAAWAADYLGHRNILSGSFRADPRLDPLDMVSVENKYTKVSALVTDVTYVYNGAFRGSYTARAIGTGESWYYAGEIYAGEV